MNEHLSEVLDLVWDEPETTFGFFLEGNKVLKDIDYEVNLPEADGPVERTKRIFMDYLEPEEGEA